MLRSPETMVHQVLLFLLTTAHAKTVVQQQPEITHKIPARDTDMFQTPASPQKPDSNVAETRIMHVNLELVTGNANATDITEAARSVVKTTQTPNNQTTPDVTNIQTTPDVTNIQTTSDVTDTQPTPDVTFIQTTPDVTHTQTTHDVTHTQTTPDVTYTQTTHDVTYIQTTHDVTHTQTTHDVRLPFIPVERIRNGISKILTKVKSKTLGSSPATKKLLGKIQTEALKSTREALGTFAKTFSGVHNLTSNKVNLLENTLNEMTGSVVHDLTESNNNANDTDINQDWSALDELPDCSNQTSNNTLCIYRNLTQVYNDLEDDYDYGDFDDEDDIAFAKRTGRAVRKTREFQVLSRRKRFSPQFKKKHLSKLPVRLREQLEKMPDRKQEKIEGLSKEAREIFFEKLMARKSLHFPSERNRRGAEPRARRVRRFFKKKKRRRRKKGRRRKHGKGRRRKGKGGKGGDQSKKKGGKGKALAGAGAGAAGGMVAGKALSGKGGKGGKKATSGKGGKGKSGRKTQSGKGGKGKKGRKHKKGRKGKGGGKAKSGKGGKGKNVPIAKSAKPKKYLGKPLNLNEAVNKNRLYGYKDQIEEQKERMQDHRILYKKFNEYHECNKKKIEWYEKPWKQLKLFYKVEGQSLKLSCRLCTRPDENPEDYELRWIRRLAEKSEVENVPVLSRDDEDKGDDENRFYWTGKGKMVISDLRVDDTGQYICLRDNQYEAVHLVEVVLKEPTEQVVGKMMVKEKKGKPPAKPVKLATNNLKAYSEWTEWTPCSKCDARGIQKRFGICHVKKLDKKKSIRPKDAVIFKYISGGIACHSNFLPPYIQKIKQILKRKSEIHVRYCYEECPKPPMTKTIKTKFGKKMQVLKSSKGYKKLKKHLDKIPKLVRRRTVYVAIGEKVQVNCTRNINPTASVRWQKNYKILDPVELPKVTKDRMHITSAHKLLIDKTEKHDDAIYSCWINGQLRKTTKVKVFKGQNTGDKNKVAWLGIIMTVITVILVLKNLGKNRKLGREKYGDGT